VYAARVEVICVGCFPARILIARKDKAKLGERQIGRKAVLITDAGPRLEESED
jgi:hypothetical protein